ncbi:FAD-dependent oxidoreductase [filamentous cyanobacterium CCP1]|nr:FAD-dependent oxidoreductase [filamentous cyanobacterium CCP2]PSB67865.1 FAD-dependent oxidoreductase [filamentous cyanobacterium CCP1]
MTQQPTRICILGGGFGGLYTALNLSQMPWNLANPPEITLVDQRDRFLFAPLLYELLTGELETWEIAPPFTELLANTKIRFHQSAVNAIDTGAKQVQLADETRLDYDYLVLAMGGETPMDLVPGAADYAIPFRTLSDAYRLEEKLRLLEQSDLEKIRVAIVGAGYSGVELACKLAERLGDRGRLRIIEIADQILKTSPEFNRETATKALTDRGVWLDLETTVESITADSITLQYKGKTDTLPVDIVLWTVGTKTIDEIDALPLKKNSKGQIVVSPTLQVVDHPELFALGDLADSQDAEGKKVPGTAQAAFQQADYASWNIWASITDRPLLPFRYSPLGEMMTLGTDNATLSGLGIKLQGLPAHLARRLLYLYRMPTLDHQIKVGLNWIAQPIREILLNF